MANYKVTDTELTSIANAIRTKGGTNASLVFPEGFVNGIDNIQYYPVVFKNEAGDGNEIHELKACAYGETPVYTGDGPTSPSGIFDSWTPTPGPTTEASIYNAIYISKTRMLLKKTITEYNDDTIEEVGDHAFRGCSSLTSISLSAATSIGDYAFNGCSALTNVSLPVATSIGDGAFNGCSVLTSISLPVATTINKLAFDGCSALTSVSLSVAISIGSYAFRGCSSLTSISLPAATNIGGSAFYRCSQLPSISLPAATSIGSYAFADCSALTSVILGANQVATLDSYYSIPSGTIFYVPDTLVNSYKAATSWSSIASQIKGISELSA